MFEEVGKKELETWNKTIHEQYVAHDMELPIATSGPVTLDETGGGSKTAAAIVTSTTKQVFVIRDAYDDDVVVRKALQDQHLKLYGRKPTFSNETEVEWVRGLWKWGFS